MEIATTFHYVYVYAKVFHRILALLRKVDGNDMKESCRSRGKCQTLNVVPKTRTVCALLQMINLAF